MVDIVHNAGYIFGVDFGKWIVQGLEVAFRELHAKITNHDFFRMKPVQENEGQVSKQSADIEEVAQNELTFIVGIGSVLQLFDTINSAIQSSTTNNSPQYFLSNRNVLEKLNKKVVQSKASAIAKSIIVVMIEGMNEMV